MNARSIALVALVGFALFAAASAKKDPPKLPGYPIVCSGVEDCNDDCRNKKGKKDDDYRDCFFDCLKGADSSDDEISSDISSGGYDSSSESGSGSSAGSKKWDKFYSRLDDVEKWCEDKRGKKALEGKVQKCMLKQVKNACPKAF